MRSLLALLLCLVSVTVLAQPTPALTSTITITDNDSAPLIAASRRIDWDPGVRGGIPTRSTIFYTDTGGLDSVSTLNTQIAACTPGQVIQLQAGTYTVSSQIQISKGCTLRGASAATTILSCSAAWHCIQMGDFPSAPSAIGVTGSPAKGDTTITVASTTGLAVNDYIAIDQLNDGSEVKNDDTAFGAAECRSGAGTRCLGQIVKITAINSLVLTVSPALHHAYASGFTPQVWEVTSVTDGAAVEDLTVTRTNDASGQYNNFTLVACSGCWLKNVVSNTPDAWHVSLDRAVWSTVRDSYFNGGQSNASGRAYGVVSNLFATDNLIENNIFYRNRHSMVLQNGATGNVYGYNYSSQCFQGNPAEAWLATDMNAHGAHPTMNLFEGNVGCKLYADNAHGSSSYNTAFRNHITRESAYPSITQALRAVDIEQYNTGWNIVGNSLGQAAHSWDALDPGATRSASSGRYVYTYGYFSDGQGTSAAYTTVRDSTYRHGNWDYQTDTQTWDASNSNHTLPSSLYSVSTPAFYTGSCIYPPVDPSSGAEHTLPAQDRFDGGDGTCAGGGGADPSTAGCRGTPTTTLGSGAAATVASAISTASNGDCIRLPSSCSATWTTAVALSSSKFITLDLNGCTITLSGASGTFTIASHASGLNRLTNGTVTKSGTGYTDYQGPFIISDSASGYGLRVDHIRFKGSGLTLADGTYIDANGQGKAVIDSNIFEDMENPAEFIHINGWGAGATTGWTTSVSQGSEALFYLEANTFTSVTSGGHFETWIQGYYGARVVIRFNQFHNVRVDAHGTPNNVGQRWWEIYNNDFEQSGDPFRFGQTINLRAGSGRVFNNTNSGTDTGGNIGMGEEDITSYPATYQIGRGTNQVLDVAYSWGNEQSLALDTCECQNGPPSGMVVLNRDVFVPSVGTRASRPSTCSVGQAYFSNDQGGNWNTLGGDSTDGALDVCFVTNTWTNDAYVPAAYPHSLRME